MNIRKHLDAFMAKLGYVRAPEKSELVVASLKIEVDDSQVRAALEPVQQLAVAATEAEAALAKLWNFQAAMQYRHPYTGAGSVSGCSTPASDAATSAPRVEAGPAFDPFAPVFQLDGDGAGGKLGVTITLKPGTVVYLINATGPRSNAITYSADGPKHVLVRPVVEIEPES